MSYKPKNTSGAYAILGSSAPNVNVVVPGDSFASHVNTEGRDPACLPSIYADGVWVGLSVGASTSQPTATLEAANTFAELYGYGTDDEVDGNAERWFDNDFYVEKTPSTELSTRRFPWYQNGLTLVNDGTTTTQGTNREVCRVNLRVDRMLRFTGKVPWTSSDTVLVASTHVVTNDNTDSNTNVFRIGNSSGKNAGGALTEKVDPRLLPTNTSMQLQVDLAGSFAALCPTMSASIPFEATTFWTSGNNLNGSGNNAHVGNGAANLEIGWQLTHSSFATPSNLAVNLCGIKAGRKASGGGQESGLHLVFNGINSADTPNLFAAATATGSPGKNFTVADWKMALRASVFDRSRPLIILIELAVENKTQAAFEGHFERWADAINSLAEDTDFDYSGAIHAVIVAPHLHAVTGLSTREEYEAAHDAYEAAAIAVAASHGIGFASIRRATNNLWFGNTPDAGASAFIASKGFSALASTSGGTLLDGSDLHRLPDSGWSDAVQLEFRQFFATMLVQSLNPAGVGGSSMSTLAAIARRRRR